MLPAHEGAQVRMIEIRQAASADLPAMSHIWYQQRAIESSGGYLTLAPEAAERWLADTQAALVRQNCVLFVAESDGEIAAFCRADLEPAPAGVDASALCIVRDLAADVHEYRAGMMGALVDAVRRWLDEQGGGALVAQVHHRAAAAQAFWRAQGAVDWMDWLWLK